MKTDMVHGVMAITNNTNAFNLTAAVDPTLQTNSDYVLFTGTGAPWAGENLFGGMTFNTDRLVIPVTGIYRVDLWSNIIQFPSNTARVGAQYRVNGATFGPRKVVDKSNSAGDVGQLSGFGIGSFTAGDFIQIYVASDTTGGMIMRNANTLLTLVRET